MIVDKHHFLTPQGGLCVLDIHSSAGWAIKKRKVDFLKIKISQVSTCLIKEKTIMN